MERDPRSTTDDPTAERTADDIAVRRVPEGRDETPRRYERDTEDDPVMPAEDPSLGTKI